MKKTMTVLLSLVLVVIFSILYFYHSAKEPIRIVFASDNNYLPHLATAITSIVKNADKDDKFDFYLLESSVSEENKIKLKSYTDSLKVPLTFVHIDDKRLESVKIRRGILTKATYLRFFIPDVFHFDKILYLDSDILVFKSLRKFFDSDVTNVYSGVIVDRISPENPLISCKGRLENVKTCFNGGVLLLNLKKMRQDNITSDTLFKNMDKLYKEQKLLLEDQDVLNVTFNNNVKFFPFEYNFTNDFGRDSPDKIILHLIVKPWYDKNWKDHIYWKYRKETPWQMDPHLLFEDAPYPEKSS